MENATSELIGGSGQAEVLVRVDQNRSLDEMIKAGGYSLVNEAIIEEHFSVSGKSGGAIVVALLHFGHGRISGAEEVVAKMKEKGFRPASIQELLAFGEAYPTVQNLFPIVALGSVWQGEEDDSHHTPFLDAGPLGRYLCLNWFGSGFSSTFRFLAVRGPVRSHDS